MHQGADSISCKVVISAGDEALWMVQYPKGNRGLPGGRAEPGESFEQAAQREVQEEIGAQIKDLQLVDAWLMPHDPLRNGQDCLTLLYLGTMIGQPRDTPSADGERAVKVPLSEVPQTELRPLYQQALQKLIQQGRLAA